MLPSPHTRKLGLRNYIVSRSPLGSLALRPGDSLTIPRMALSVGFRTFGFPPVCDSSYRAPDCCPGGISPAECASLRLDALVRRILAHRVSKVALTERDDLRQTLRLDRANKALRVGVQIRASWQPHRLHARGPENSLEHIREERVTVVDQIARAAEESASVRFLAIWFIHSPFGCRTTPTISTLRVLRSMTKSTK